MPQILIIEDEAMLRSTMVRGLSKLPGIEVSDAGTLTDALNQIDDRVPELILSDLDLPDRSGVELLGELGKRQIHIPVVFITAFLKAYQAQIPLHANVEVFEKPVPLEDLRNIVQSYLKKVKPDSGATPFLVADYIQLAGIGRHSVVIKVKHHGIVIGKILVVAGEIWFATDREGEGVDAFYRLARFEDSRIICQVLRDPPSERNIEMSWEALLMEAARQEDEENRDKQVTTLPDSKGEQGLQFQKALELGLDGVLSKNYTAALCAFLEAESICPGNKGVLSNIHRLREMGYGEGQDEGDFKRGGKL